MPDTDNSLEKTPSGNGYGRQSTFASLKFRNFRLFFAGSLCVFGAVNSMVLVRGFLVYELTGSFAALGALAMAILVPSFFATLYGGVIADRWPKHKIILLGQLAMSLFALWIGLLLFFDTLKVWHLMVAAAAQGGIFGLIAPAWHAIIPETVGKPYIMNATSLNMGGMNFTQLVMPALSGYALALAGPEYVYAAITLLFFLSCILISYVITVTEENRSEKTATSLGNPFIPFKQRIDYIRQRPAVSSLLTSNLFLTALSAPFLFLLPGYVKDILRLGPDMLGNMVSISSIGALAAAMTVASMASRHRGYIFLATSALLGIALFLFSASNSIWLTIPMLLLIGGGQSCRVSLAATLCQTYVSAQYRGRVGSLLSMQSTAAQLGTFSIGFVAEMFDARWALGGMGLALTAICLMYYFFSPSLRKMQ